jgi:hypothetical protein
MTSATERHSARTGLEFEALPGLDAARHVDSPDLYSEDPHWIQNEGIAGPPFASARW